MINIQRFTDPATGEVITLNNAIKATASALTAVTSAGIKFDVKKYPNDRLMFLFLNSHATVAKDVKILKPTNGGYAADTADLVLDDVAAGGTAVAYVETARYANNDGTIICQGESTDVKVVAVVLGR